MVGSTFKSTPKELKHIYLHFIETKKDLNPLVRKACGRVQHRSQRLVVVDEQISADRRRNSAPLFFVNDF